MFDQNLSGSSWMMHSYFASRKKTQYFVHFFLWKFFSWHIFATDITNPFVCKRFFAARKAFQQQISTVAGQRVPFSLFILQEKTPFNISTWFCVMFGTIFRKETDIVVVSCCIMLYHCIMFLPLFSYRMDPFNCAQICLPLLNYARFRSNKTALRLVGCHRLVDIDWRSKLLPQVCSKSLLEPWEKNAWNHGNMVGWPRTTSVMCTITLKNSKT